jgi:hypothetical protein
MWVGVDMSAVSLPHRATPAAAAPRQYASKLTEMLVQAGGRPLWVPGVAVERLGDPQHELQVCVCVHVCVCVCATHAFS